ncbi:MAG: peptidoglycan-associated lipoprotein, partial [Nitrospirae bacterium]
MQETAQKASAPEPEKKAEPAKEAPVAAKEEPKMVETVPVKEVVEPKPVSAAFENINFDFDKYFIRDDAKPTLKVVSDWLVKNKSSNMLLEGHCDERGTNEYNLALG